MIFRILCAKYYEHRLKLLYIIGGDIVLDAWYRIVGGGQTEGIRNGN